MYHLLTHFIILGQDPCPCAFYIVDMVPYTISKLSAKSQFCAIQTADNTDGKVRIEIILLLENNKMLPGKIKTEKKITEFFQSAAARTADISHVKRRH